jgi:predicted nuclease with TOPRIM domain
MTRTEQAELEELHMTPEQLQERTERVTESLRANLAPAPEQPQPEKRTRLSVAKLRERFQELHDRALANLAQINERIESLKIERTQAASECVVWARAIAEMDRD